jgi:hypothetical protein
MLLFLLGSLPKINSEIYSTVGRHIKVKSSPCQQSCTYPYNLIDTSAMLKVMWYQNWQVNFRQPGTLWSAQQN